MRRGTITIVDGTLAVYTVCVGRYSIVEYEDVMPTKNKKKEWKKAYWQRFIAIIVVIPQLFNGECRCHCLRFRLSDINTMGWSICIIRDLDTF